ncbi:unnamed protein product [Bubo scandiacus]
MVSASEDRCPICLNTLSNAACTMTCLHRFCFNCLWQWAEIKLECPVCRRTRRYTHPKACQGDGSTVPERPVALRHGQDTWAL